MYAAASCRKTASICALRDAEKLLNDEFAHVLHIPQQDVPDYIRSRMEREA